MRRFLTAAVCCLFSLFLSSCDFIPLAANAELLAAPVLSRQQAEVSEALRRILNLSDIVYKYPQSGEHRSSFVFFDMDGDGLQEAVIFYAYTFAPSEVRAMILRQSAPGQWYSWHDLPGSGDEVDFLQFTPVFPGGGRSLVVGWRNTAYQQSWLGIYTMRDRLSEDLLQRYTTHVLHDFDDDGLSEVVLTQRTGEGNAVKLLHSQGGRLIESDSYPLYEESTGVAQMMFGRLWDGSTGLFIDERIDNSFYGTEVFRVVSGNVLIPLCVGSQGTDTPLWSNFASTFREEDVLCVDLTKSGAAEVPRVEDLPGGAEVLNSAENALPPLVRYMRLEENGFQVRFNAVMNVEAGYMIFYPDSWLGKVTLVATPESKEWSFRKYDSETGQITTELFRIRVYSTEDYLDAFSHDGIELDSRGILRYYGYIPRTLDEPLAITPAQAKELFALI